MSETDDLLAGIEALEAKLKQARESITKRFIGQERVVDLTLSVLLCGGHGLLIGLPGLGKTRLVETLSTVMGLDGNRIQFYSRPDACRYSGLRGAGPRVRTVTGRSGLCRVPCSASC